MAESGYSYNAQDKTLEHYYQKPPDYNEGTYQSKEVLLSNLSGCRFSFWDGQTWQDTWQEGGLPKTIKINFKFEDEKAEQEFIASIPVGS